MGSKFTIKFKPCYDEVTGHGYYEPKGVVEVIRHEARSRGWSRIAGIKEYWRTEHGATLRTGNDMNWTSITFKDQLQYDNFTKAVLFELLKQEE